MTSLPAFSHKSTERCGPGRLDTLTMLAWSGWTVLLGLPPDRTYLTGEPRLLYAPRLYRLVVIVRQRCAPAVHHFTHCHDPVDHVDRHLGVEGTIPPLVAGCAPFFARLVETALREDGARPADWWRPVGRWAAAPGSLSGTRYCRSRGPADRRCDRDAILLVDYTDGGVIGGGLGDRLFVLVIRFQTDVMVVVLMRLRWYSFCNER